MEGNDVFVCLPTGFGKSHRYFCLPSLIDIIRNKVVNSLAKVLSPLVVLMFDQMEILRSKVVIVTVVYGNKADDSESQKQSILKLYTYPNGHLRIVIATVAFGMGIDCPSIRRVIHWGPPTDLKGYIQETGRTGHDGKKANVTLYYSKRDISFQYRRKKACHHTSDILLFVED
uniref:DNA 3'-5' helicase n=1 Tax=Amphimedon queenslandica TaxID=400682 RepID=A0A1X7V1D6_AMPQE